MALPQFKVNDLVIFEGQKNQVLEDLGCATPFSLMYQGTYVDNFQQYKIKNLQYGYEIVVWEFELIVYNPSTFW